METTNKEDYNMAITAIQTNNKEALRSILPKIKNEIKDFHIWRDIYSNLLFQSIITKNKTVYYILLEYKEFKN